MIRIIFNFLVFNVTLLCFLEKAVLINAFMRWSQLQPNGLFRHQNFDLQFYRDCTPNGTSNKTIITGNPIVVSIQYAQINHIVKK